MIRRPRLDSDIDTGILPFQAVERLRIRAVAVLLIVAGMAWGLLTSAAAFTRSP